MKRCFFDLVLLVSNPPASNRRSYWVNDDLNCNANNWLEKAEEKPGSWWPDWDGWMNGHSSGSVQAPTKLGNGTFGVIEQAPGRYVRQKSN